MQPSSLQTQHTPLPLKSYESHSGTTCHLPRNLVIEVTQPPQQKFLCLCCFFVLVLMIHKLMPIPPQPDEVMATGFCYWEKKETKTMPNIKYIHIKYEAVRLSSSVFEQQIKKSSLRRLKTLPEPAKGS